MSPFIMYSSQNPWNFLDMEVIICDEKHRETATRARETATRNVIRLEA